MENASGKHLPVNKRLVLAAALWLSAVCLMLAAVITDRPRYGGPALLLGLMATVPTGWLIVEYVVIQERRKAVRCIAEAIGRGQAEGRVRPLR